MRRREPSNRRLGAPLARESPKTRRCKPPSRVWSHTRGSNPRVTIVVTDHTQTAEDRWNGESSPVQVRAVVARTPRDFADGADAQPNAGPNRRGLTPLTQFSSSSGDAVRSSRDLERSGTTLLERSVPRSVCYVYLPTYLFPPRDISLRSEPLSVHEHHVLVRTVRVTGGPALGAKTYAKKVARGCFARSAPPIRNDRVSCTNLSSSYSSASAIRSAQPTSGFA